MHPAVPKQAIQDMKINPEITVPIIPITKPAVAVPPKNPFFLADEAVAIAITPNIKPTTAIKAVKDKTKEKIPHIREAVANPCPG